MSSDLVVNIQGMLSSTLKPRGSELWLPSKLKSKKVGDMLEGVQRTFVQKISSVKTTALLGKGERVGNDVFAERFISM